MGTNVQVLFGAAKTKKKAQEPNPSTAKIVMSPHPEIGQSLDHDARLHHAAADEHVYAARDYVGGRITKAQYHERKRRAESLMAKTPKKHGHND